MTWINTECAQLQSIPRHLSIIFTEKMYAMHFIHPKGLWGGFGRYIGPGPVKTRRGMQFESLKAPIALDIEWLRLILIFFLILGVFSTTFSIVSLFRKIQLSKIHLDFWILVVDHHSHLHYNHDLKSSILREVSACFRRPKTVLFRLAKFLLEALYIPNWTCNISDDIHPSVQCVGNCSLKYGMYRHYSANKNRIDNTF